MQLASAVCCLYVSYRSAVNMMACRTMNVLLQVKMRQFFCAGDGFFVCFSLLFAHIVGHDDDDGEVCLVDEERLLVVGEIRCSG